jgi:hypothetical protein
MNANNTELVIYQTEDGYIKINGRMEDETVWLPLDQKRLFKIGDNK